MNMVDYTAYEMRSSIVFHTYSLQYNCIMKLLVFFFYVHTHFFMYLFVGVPTILAVIARKCLTELCDQGLCLPTFQESVDELTFKV